MTPFSRTMKSVEWLRMVSAEIMRPRSPEDAIPPALRILPSMKTPDQSSRLALRASPAKMSVVDPDLRS